MDEEQETGVGTALAETIALWVKIVATMGPDELDSFESRAFRQWGRNSLGDVRAAIRERRLNLTD